MINMSNHRQLGVHLKPKHRSIRCVLFVCIITSLFVCCLMFYSLQVNETFTTADHHVTHRSNILEGQNQFELDTGRQNDAKIDVVYTWVNGSDPMLIKSMYETRQKLDRQMTIDKQLLLRIWSKSKRCSNKMTVAKRRGEHYYLELPIAYIGDWSKVKDQLSRWRSEGLIYNANDGIVYFKDLYDLKTATNSINSSVGKVAPTFLKLDCNGKPWNTSDLGGFELVSLPSLAWQPKNSDSNTLSNATLSEYNLYDSFGTSRLVISMAVDSNSLEQVEIRHSLGTNLEPVTLVVGNSEFYYHLLNGLSTKQMLKRVSDNDELKYSLRSLEKYAPWIGNVYIVTNGQIPVWLNTSNPRIKIVAHDQIFTNKSHLPTFNSNAIESHLHRIPGLSQRFLYFNDDFQLGQPVSLEDFYTLDHGIKIYFDWQVKPCAVNCPSHLIKNRECDEACNNYACLWDGDDCEMTNSLQQNYEEPGITLPRTGNTYIESVENNNRLFNEAFGAQERKVIHHLPHFLDKTIIEQLHMFFEDEFEATSTHQLRHEHDMKLAFSFYNFVISQYLISNPAALLEQFDKDNSGSLSKSELLALVVNMFGRLALKQVEVKMFMFKIEQCQNSVKSAVKWSIRKSCPKLIQFLQPYYESWRKSYRHEIVSDMSDVIFFKVQSNLVKLRKDLNALKKNSYKFLCFADKLDYGAINATITARRLIHDYYHLKFPGRSEYELHT